MQTRFQLTPSTIGLLGGAGSALFYTITNVCLRSLHEVDPVWVSTVKATPTLAIVLPLVWLQIPRPVLPANIQRLGFVSQAEIAWLVGTSIGVQILGNVAFQWALPIVGLSVSIPIVLGTMLIAGALAGKFVLGEPVSRRKIIAMIVLTAATVLLSVGAGSQPDASELAGGIAQTTRSTWIVVLGLAAVITSGIAYAVQGTVMRRSMQRGLSVSKTLLIISSSGLVFLGLWSIERIGFEGIAATSPSHWATMFAAGFFNAVAFFSMGKSLQHVSVLYVQLLNASQVAVSALAGWLLFSEPMTNWIFAGLLMTTVGLMVAGFKDDYLVKKASDNSTPAQS